MFKWLLVVLLFCPVALFSQFTIQELSYPRSGIAVDFAGDKIILTGGSDVEKAEFYDINTGEIEIQTYGRDGFTEAKVLSNDRYSFFYSLVGVNLSDRQFYIYDKQENLWLEKGYSNIIYDEAAFISDSLVFFFPIRSTSDLLVYNLKTFETSFVDIPFQERDFAIADIGSKVYCVGGTLDWPIPSNALNIYDKVSREWSSEELELKSIDPSVLVHNGKLIVTGGDNNNSKKLEIFDLSTKTSNIINLPFTNFDPILSARNEKLVIAGGARYDAYVLDLNTLELSPRHILEDDTRSGSRQIQSIILDDKIYFTGARYPRLHVYDFIDNSWSSIELSSVKYKSALFSYKGRLYIAGGETNEKDLSNELLILMNEESNSTQNPIVYLTDILGTTNLTDQPIVIGVVDSDGQDMASTVVDKSYIDLRGYPSGKYTISVSSGDKVFICIYEKTP